MAAPNAALPADPAAGLGLYVHWPYCDRICPYCDFNVHRTRPVDTAAWRAAFRAEMAHARAVQGAAAPVLTSIYFGGGTPSLMPPGLVAEVIADAADTLGLADGAEITLEANPTSSEIAAFAAFKSAGVNRLSLGIQSLDDDALHFLGRDHTAADAMRGLDHAAEVFGRTTFDLIYGRPGQTVAAWERELRAAQALSAGHMSLYQLTVETGTAFDAAQRRGALVMPDDDALADFYEMTQALMEAAGLPAYEVSNHADAGEPGRHNLTYWRYGAYVGIGPGAHGRLVVDGRRVTTETILGPAAWLQAVAVQGHGIAETTVLDPAACVDELLVTGLRLVEGIPARRFEAVSGQPLSALRKTARMAPLLANDLLVIGDAGMAATAAGRRVLNAVIAEVSEALSSLPDRT